MPRRGRASLLGVGCSPFEGIEDSLASDLVRLRNIISYIIRYYSVATTKADFSDLSSANIRKENLAML